MNQDTHRRLSRIRQPHPCRPVLPTDPRLPGPLAAGLADSQAAGDPRGRAELRLAERSALWNAKPENRHLPSAWEWANIRLLTRRRDWTEPQRRMMKRAGRVHGLRTLGIGHAGLLDHLGRRSRAMAHYGPRLWWSRSRRSSTPDVPCHRRATRGLPPLG